MFRTAALVAILATAATASELRADSTVGRALLKSATVVEEARALQNNYNYNGQQNQNQERDASFLANYHIKYLGCSSTISYDQEGNGGDENPLILSNLVKFTLCQSCGSCSGGGQYVVGMQEFIQAYNEMQMNEQEYRCEMAREASQYVQCNYQDDQACQNEYFMNNGLSECIQYEGQEAFELDRYLECGQVEWNNNNNNNNNNGNNGQNQNYNGNNADYWYEYFMGPYCASDGKSIKFRMYYDDGCTVVADGDHSSIFEKRTGFELPYHKSSIISPNECFSCEDADQARENQYQQNNQNYNNNQNGNWYYEKQPSQLCQESYERAARCEKGMDVMYPDYSGCDFINVYLPKLEGASNALSRVTGGSSGAAVAFAWVFAITTILFGAYAYFLYRKIKRGAVSLSSTDGAMA